MFKERCYKVCRRANKDCLLFDFLALDEKDIRDIYKLNKDQRDWKIADAKENIRSVINKDNQKYLNRDLLNNKKIKDILEKDLRPFIANVTTGQEGASLHFLYRQN